VPACPSIDCTNPPPKRVVTRKDRSSSRITVCDPGTRDSFAEPTEAVPKFRVTVTATSEVPLPAPRPQPASATATAIAPAVAASRSVTWRS
jgi:hypothetical protein